MRFEQRKVEAPRNAAAEVVAVLALVVVVVTSLVLMYALFQRVSEAFARLY